MRTPNAISYTNLTIPAFLSPQEKKRTLFPIELAFRETWEDLNRQLGTGLEPFLKNHTAIVFKPEAIKGRRLFKALEILEQQGGFVPVAHGCFRFNRHSIRSTWQYQFNAASRERIDLFDLLQTTVDSLYIILKDTKADQFDSPSEHLTEFKGCSSLEERKPHHLRYQLGWVNVMMNFVHAPDDTADFVREMGIFFEAHQREALIAQALSGEGDLSGLHDTITALYETYPEHDLSFDHSLSRLLSALEGLTSNGHSTQGMIQVLDHLKVIQSGESRDWRPLLPILESGHPEINDWDFLTVASALTALKLPGVTAYF